MTEDPDEFLRRLFTDASTRTERASDLYALLVQSGQVHSSRVHCLTYRCHEQKCALIDVIDVPSEGVVVGFPRYKTSPDETERSSSASGRAKNTEDGNRRWKKRAAFTESIGNLALSCDHLRQVLLTEQRLNSDWSAGHTDVRVRRDGTLYVVR